MYLSSPPPVQKCEMRLLKDSLSFQESGVATFLFSTREEKRPRAAQGALERALSTSRRVLKSCHMRHGPFDGRTAPVCTPCSEPDLLTYLSHPRAGNSTDHRSHGSRNAWRSSSWRGIAFVPQRALHAPRRQQGRLRPRPGAADGCPDRGALDTRVGQALGLARGGRNRGWRHIVRGAL